MRYLYPMFCVMAAAAKEGTCDAGSGEASLLCQPAKGTGLIQKKGKVFKASISKPPPPPKPAPPPKPSPGQSSAKTPPEGAPPKPDPPAGVPTGATGAQPAANVTYAIGTTGLPCTVFDDCKNSGTVTGDRPNCVCSNGCHWGVDCGRDAVVLASEIFVPDNHCAEDGSCEPGKPLVIAGKKVQDKPERLCYTYNEGRFIPDKSSGGYCLGIRTKSYADFCTAVVPKTEADFAEAMRWANANTDVQQQVSCTTDSFCKYHGKASGDLGTCKCELPDDDLVHSADDFDHYAAVYESQCTSALYCNDQGTANFVPDGLGGGSCTCSCSSDYSGHHCELVAGTPCTDREDCSGHGIASGVRPYCKCENCMKFSGDHCDVWEWYGEQGIFDN